MEYLEELLQNLHLSKIYPNTSIWQSCKLFDMRMRYRKNPLNLFLDIQELCPQSIEVQGQIILSISRLFYQSQKFRKRSIEQLAFFKKILKLDSIYSIERERLITNDLLFHEACLGSKLDGGQV